MPHYYLQDAGYDIVDPNYLPKETAMMFRVAKLEVCVIKIGKGKWVQQNYKSGRIRIVIETRTKLSAAKLKEQIDAINIDKAVKAFGRADEIIQKQQELWELFNVFPDEPKTKVAPKTKPDPVDEPKAAKPKASKPVVVEPRVTKTVEPAVKPVKPKKAPLVLDDIEISDDDAFEEAEQTERDMAIAKEKARVKAETIKRRIAESGLDQVRDVKCTSTLDTTEDSDTEDMEGSL